MKLSKEELKKKIDEKISDDDLKIELLEDIEDSFESDDSEKISKEEYEKVISERDEIKQKYKDRFLNNEESKEDDEEPEEKGLEEKDVIDVKEIFEDEEDK